MNGIPLRRGWGLLPMLVASAVCYADDPPSDTSVNQSISPNYSSVDQQTALEAALSCSSSETLDPTNLQSSSTTVMSMPTAPSDAQLATTTSRIGPRQNPSADPVLGTGEFTLDKTHLRLPGFGVDFEFTLRYRSRVNHQSPVGFGWTHNYERHIEDLNPDGKVDCAGQVYYISEKSERIAFVPNGVTAVPGVLTYRTVSGAPLRLERRPGNTSHYVLTDGTGLSYHFGRSATTGSWLLGLILDPTGNAIRVTWDDTVKNGDGGIVTQVKDTVGRTIYYNYVRGTAPVLPQQDVSAKCPDIVDGDQSYADWQCLAQAAIDSRALDYAVLKCISFATDCNQPLVSLQQSSPDTRAEFDLTSVLDAEGRGPSFTYYIQPEVGTYIPDTELAAACHTICDTQAMSTDWSCHNLDLCGEASLRKTVNERCASVGDRLKMQFSFDNQTQTPQPTTYSCTTYAAHACTTLGGKCRSQNWYTDHYGHWYRAEKMLCPYDDGSLGNSQSLPERDRNAACDGWLADWISYCNSPLADVQAALAQPGDLYGFGVIVNGHERTMREQFCEDFILEDSDNSINGTQVCNDYMADCRAEVEATLRAKAPSCPKDCMETCVAEKSSKGFDGRRRYSFGHPQDLNHNLVTVTDGDGRLVVENTYGVDPFQSSFDRVIKNKQTDTIADNVISYEYHELRGEEALSGVNFETFFAELGLTAFEQFAQALCSPEQGCIPYYTVTPDSERVTPLGQFQSVDICPAQCEKWAPRRVVPYLPAEGMLPWRLVDPERTGFFNSPFQYAFEREGTAAFSVRGVGESRKVEPGEVVFETASKGERAIIRADRAGQFTLEGSQRLFDTLFGPGNALELRFDAEGKAYRFRAPTAVKVRVGVPMKADPSPPAGPMLGTSRFPVSPAIRRLEQRSMSATRPTPTTTASDATAHVLLDELPGIVVAGGRWPGAGAIVLHRNGRSATLSLPAAGDTLGTLAAPNGGRISVLMGRVPGQVELRGDASTATDRAGHAQLFVADKVPYLFPADEVKWVRDSAAQPKDWREAIASQLVTEGMVCEQWSTGPAKILSGATDGQRPEHAVVVHDLHGVVHTDYFDKEWRLLRVVNHNAKETVNYTYKNGTMFGYQAASGVRTCQQANVYGQPTEVSTFPSPGFQGDTSAHVTRYAYKPSGRLTDKWTEPGTSNELHEHLERDAWERVVWIDTPLSSSTSVRTKFVYPSRAATDPQASDPAAVIDASGAQTQIAGDPSAGGPSRTSLKVTGDNPHETYARYDSLGRRFEFGRPRHPGSVVKTQYDKSGLPIVAQTADLLNPGSFVERRTYYNSSRQPDHVSDALIDRYLTYDPYDHLQLEIAVPKSGKAESKSTCNHYSIDGLLEYSISPQGIVTHNQYDAASRLVQVDQGNPADLSAWTTACLTGRRAPGSFREVFQVPEKPTAGLTKGKTPQQAITQFVPRSQLADAPAIPTWRQTVVGRLVVHGYTGDGSVVAAVPPKGLKAFPPGAFVIPQPSWPAAVPSGDAGMQTIRRISHAPGGFLLSDTDGSGVGRYVATDGFGRVIDEMNGDPAKVDPATLTHRFRGFDFRDRVTWEAVAGPGAPPYAKPTALYPALGAMAEYGYDGLDRRTRTDHWFFADGKAIGAQLKTSTSVVFNDDQRKVITQVDSRPPSTLTLDEMGRIVREDLPNGLVSTTRYREINAGDEVTRQRRGPSGALITLVDTLDDAGHLRFTRQGVDELLRQDFDSFGRLTLRRTWGRETTTIELDAYSREFQRTLSAAPSPDRVVEHDYDRDDRAITSAVQNATGRVTTGQTFDGLSRLIRLTDPLGRVTSFDYFPNSRRLKQDTDPAGTVIARDYDFAGRLITARATPGGAPGLDPKVLVRAYTYAPLGGYASATVSAEPADAASPLQFSFRYDSFGNATSEASNGYLPMSVAREFDVFSRPSAISLVGAASPTPLARIDRQYDELQRLALVSLNGKALAALDYAGLGGPTTIRYGDRAVDPASATGVTTSLQYDVRGRRSGIDVANAAGTFLSQADRLGRDGIPRARTRRYGLNGPSYTDVFVPDTGGALIQEAQGVSGATLPNGELADADVTGLVASGQRRAQYQLDGASNWTHLESEQGITTPQIDASNQYTSFGALALSANAAGQTTALGSRSLTFDAFGQLSMVVDSGQTYQFTYDALGRRIASSRSSAAGQADRSYTIWDSLGVLAQANSASDTSAYRLNVSGDGLDQYLATVGALGTGPTRYLHQGADRSVIGASDGSGLMEAYGYSAYGQPRFLNPDGTAATDGQGKELQAASSGQSLLFQGQTYDAALNVYSMRARHYSPTLGRFLSLDPASPTAANRYLFADGMPLTRVDPLGLSSQLAIDDTQWMSSPDFNMSTPPPALAPAPVLTCTLCYSSPDFQINPPSIGPAQGPPAPPSDWARDRQRVKDAAAGVLRITPEDLDDPKFIDRFEDYTSLAHAIDSMTSWEKFKLTVGAALALASFGNSLAVSGTPTVFAGHGVEASLAGTTTIPKGVALTLPGQAGIAIPDGLGQLMEAGRWDLIWANPRYAAIMEGSTTYLPGAHVPNLILSPPTGLTTLPGSITVGVDTMLSDLLSNAKGLCVWAACRTSP